MPHKGKNRNYKSKPGHKKPKLGTGERFKTLKRKLKKKGAKNPAALAAFIGRKSLAKRRWPSCRRRGGDLIDGGTSNG